MVFKYYIIEFVQDPPTKLLPIIQPSLESKHTDPPHYGFGFSNHFKMYPVTILDCFPFMNAT